MNDPYTCKVRLCDDEGKVSDTPVEPGSPGASFSPTDLTYIKLHNNLRARNSNPDTRKPVEGGWQCTGHAHLAGEHIRCTSPAHAPKPATASAGAVLASAGGTVVSDNTVNDWTHPDFDWPLPPITKLKAALAGYDAQYGNAPVGEQLGIPKGHADRIEAVVREARAIVEKS